MSSTEHKREEQTKLEVAKRFFPDYDTTHILGDIDFSVAVPISEGQQALFETEYLLWAEAKRGTQHHIEHSLVQLIITIGKAHTYLEHLPPAFLGAFDDEKIAFVPYYKIADIFTTNDFNWNVAPSDHKTREFDFVLSKVSGILKAETLLFQFSNDEKELRHFIRQNFVIGKSDLSKVRINKNNFTAIYQKWRNEVMPSINVNWEEAKKQGVIAADFYLADILSEHNTTLLHRLYVLLRSNHYEFARRTDEATLFNYQLTAEFKDEQEAHHKFWNRYDRPPRREYWDYIVERRDLLVPQDVRERKGSFFTPQRWVELSQKYLADELGEDWQDRYYIWDCCAGTGNLLAGLTNKYNIYASTLDQQDVDVMHERIHNMDAASRNGHGGSNLLEKHVFQFDFLNDPFFDERNKKGRLIRKSKVPDSLQKILAEPEERKRLVVYINPPYAEASNARTFKGTGKNREGVAQSLINKKYCEELGRAGNEIYAQFFARVVKETPSTVLAVFSKLKTLQGPNFSGFRKAFQAQLGRIFLVPAATFDNVTGQFPIGFQIWNTNVKEEFEQIQADVYNHKGVKIGIKQVYAYKKERYIIEWIRQFYDKKNEHISYLRFLGTDFQNNNGVFLTLCPSINDLRQVKGNWVTNNNIIPFCIYFTVRHCIEATWLNDRDQFLYPNNGWMTDYEFQTDCLIFTLFHGQNRISSKDGINHWIPFCEEEVDAQERFESHFMYDYLHGTQAAGLLKDKQSSLFEDNRGEEPYVPVDHLSDEAHAVMDAGRELWHYYHESASKTPTYHANASFYDIRLHFQGTKTNKRGKEQMNPDSNDQTYTSLLATLRAAMRHLSKHIEPKVYEYGFLK